MRRTEQLIRSFPYNIILDDILLIIRLINFKAYKRFDNKPNGFHTETVIDEEKLLTELNRIVIIILVFP